MSPAPDIAKETIALNSLSTGNLLNATSSSDELDPQPFNELQIDLGSLAIEGIDGIDPSVGNDEGENDDNDDQITTNEPVKTWTIYSAPSTPTGERDPPVAVRRPSMTTTGNDQLVSKYQDGVNPSSTNSDDGSGLIDTFLGCFKPLLSAVNKIGENIRYNRDSTSTSTALTKTTDDWNLPIESIMNDLLLIGTGNEGSVYLGKLGGQNVACKRVKSEEETNIKHLRKLNHANIVKFRGVSVSSPLFYIVMEYCPYGSLYDVLKRRRERDSYTKPTQVLDWSKQISDGVNYLHSNRLVHRDLKSPNILISEGYVLKISDFGTSKQMVNRRSQPMSFNGTSAWMAPEVIRQEPCSEKVDVWSFGIVLWEILTCSVPYQNIDPVAVMWGVGRGSLTLPIPSSAPEGFKLLMTLCWNQKPINRPSFVQIIKHLDISAPNIVLFEQEQEYAELTRAWSIEITERLANLPTIDISSTLKMSNDELMKKRQEELQHIADIRSHYQVKLQQVDTLYLELSSLMMQLQKREQEIKKKERALKIQPHTSSSSNTSSKKRTIKTIAEAREKSIQWIKEAKLTLNDPKLVSKKTIPAKTNTAGSTQQPSSTLQNTSNQSENIKASPIVTNNPESSSIKSGQRRKKASGHRRNNSKGSTSSWAPPSLDTIAQQEQKRTPINITTNIMDGDLSNSPTIISSNEISPTTSNNAPIPSISADIDSKMNQHSRQLNPKDLKLDLQNSANSPTTTYERPTTLFTYLSRKISSSDPEDYEQDTHNSARLRRRRPLRIGSPSSLASRSTKGSTHDPLTPATDEFNKTDTTNEQNKSVDGRKHPRTVSFLFTPSIINDRSPSYQPRKPFNRLTRYSSSEEGEAEETHSDHYVLDDEKHRARHQDLSRQSAGLFSSESEIYSETNQHSSSSKNESTFSDEGGHVSDERPASRESLLNSEPEHEWADRE